MRIILIDDTATRWIALPANAGRVLMGLLIVVGALYLVDDLSIRFRIPASREAFGSVRVNKFLAVPLKNGKTEFIMNGTENQTCVNSPFPHLGYAPCWYVERHKDRRENL